MSRTEDRLTDALDAMSRTVADEELRPLPDIAADRFGSGGRVNVAAELPISDFPATWHPNRPRAAGWLSAALPGGVRRHRLHHGAPAEPAQPSERLGSVAGGAAPAGPKLPTAAVRSDRAGVNHDVRGDGTGAD